MSDPAHTAVIVVHGISDPAVGSTAASTARLLERQGFVRQSQVTRSILAVNPRPGPDRTWDASVLADPPSSGGDPRPAESFDVETIRLTRNGTQTVDVWELHWADLSRPSSWWLLLLSQVYVLLLHLPVIGQYGLHPGSWPTGGPLAWLAAYGYGKRPASGTVPGASAALPAEVRRPDRSGLGELARGAVGWSSRALWELGAICHWICVGLLTGVIPLLNLTLLASCGMLAAEQLPLAAQAGVGGVGLVVAALTVNAAWSGRFATWGAGVVVAVLAVLVLSPDLAPHLLAIELLAVLGVLVWRYDAVRPGAWIAGLVVLALGVIAWTNPAAIHDLFTAELADTASGAAKTAFALHLLLIATWIGFLVVGLVAVGALLVSGALLDLIGKRSGFQDLLCSPGPELRAALVAIHALAWSCWGFFAISLAAWGGLYELAHEAGWLSDDARDLAVALLGGETNVVAFALSAGALVLGALILLFAHGPSLWLEAESGDNEKAGSWLDSVRPLVGLFATAIILAQDVALLVVLARWLGGDLSLSAAAAGEPVVVPVLYLVGAGFVAGLSAATVPVRAAFDLAFDVDTYLRTAPRPTVHRAIASRFHGLWKEVVAGAPDRIVILSHSQGTVVAVENLRRLGLPDCPAQPPIHLITMGSPLRDLYARLLPKIYGWAENPALPRGVHVWKNLYTRADYVGRALGDPVQDVPLNKGSHTAYWSDPEVAAHLDQALAGTAGLPGYHLGLVIDAGPERVTLLLGDAELHLPRSSCGEVALGADLYCAVRRVAGRDGLGTVVCRVVGERPPELVPLTVDEVHRLQAWISPHVPVGAGEDDPREARSRR